MAKKHTLLTSSAIVENESEKLEVFTIEVLANTFVEGVFKKAGSRFQVSKEFVDRILSEKDNQFRII
jgi:hypothetical protein